MRFITLVAVLLAAGCAGTTTLTPAPQANLIAKDTVQGSNAGVTMTLRTKAWEGTPPELTAVIPLLATVDNASSHPLRVRYEDFGLVTPDEKRIAALPPYDIRGTETVPIGTTGVPLAAYPYPYNGFFIAPHLHRFYPGFAPWPGPFAYDPFFYDTYYPAFARIPLPTGDMVQKALPEGVLQDGGRIAGFLYFGGVDHAEQVQFTADLVDASTGRQFGRIAIPFDVH